MVISETSRALIVWLCGLLLAMGVLGIVRQSSAQAQPANGTEAAAEATPAEPSTAVQFVLGPEGQANATAFYVEAHPGDSISLTAVVGNISDFSVEAIAYAADVSSRVNGGFVVASFEDPKTGATLWVDFPNITKDFAPDEIILQPFTVSIPVDAAPGQYVIGLAIETAQAEPMPGEAPIQVKYRLATAVFIQVAGPVEPSFYLDDLEVQIDGGIAQIVGRVVNDGNIRVRPTGEMVLTDHDGQEVARATVSLGSVFAGTEAQLAILLPALVPEGELLLSTELVDTETAASFETVDETIEVVALGVVEPMELLDVSLIPMPDAENLVFVRVQMSILNNGPLISAGEVQLGVYRDDALVERVPLAQSLTIPPGETAFDQPYIPTSGVWEAGTYSFDITVIAGDLATGSQVEVGTFEINQTIEIP